MSGSRSAAGRSCRGRGTCRGPAAASRRGRRGRRDRRPSRDGVESGERDDDKDRALRSDARGVEGDPRGVQGEHARGRTIRASAVWQCTSLFVLFPFSFISLALVWFQLVFVKLVHH